MIKKIVCAALMLALLATSSMGAFAAVTSSTEYAANGYITVTATVDDVNVGDTVTYLAYKEGTVGEGANDDNIAYIDHVTLEAGDIVGTTYTFTYTTKDTNIGSIVKQAGLRADDVTSINVDEDTLPAPAGCVIKIGGVEAVEISKDPGENGYMNIPYNGVPDSVKIGDDVVEDWYATEDGFAIPGSLWKVGDVELTVTDAAPASTVVLDGVKGYTNAKVAVVTVVGAATKYGVIFSDNASYTEAVEITGTDVTVEDGKAAKFVALGKGSDGKFMIAVEGEFAAGSTFYAKAFADGLESGAYRTVTVKNEAY